MFNDDGIRLLNKTAGEMEQLKENDQQAFINHFRSLIFNQYLMNLRLAPHTWEGETKVKCTVSNCNKINYAKESRLLLQEIQAYD